MFEVSNHAGGRYRQSLAVVAIPSAAVVAIPSAASASTITSGGSLYTEAVNIQLSTSTAQLPFATGNRCEA